ncbi:MAG: hypothetical protein J5626_04835, partial [Lachnospiraceae bacterium]|nr:hypothetical protein [Lachnospiraceae bacterium]
WEEDLEYYYREELKNKMENAGNIYEMMNLFFDKSFKDFTAVVSVEYASGINEEYYDAFYGTDMEYDDFMMGGKWLYKDGSFTKLISNVAEEVPQIYDLNNHDTLTVRYTGDGKVGNTMIGKDDYSNIGTFFSVIIYDDLLETVAVHKLY